MLLPLPISCQTHPIWQCYLGAILLEAHLEQLNYYIKSLSTLYRDFHIYPLLLLMCMSIFHHNTTWIPVR